MILNYSDLISAKLLFFYLLFNFSYVFVSGSSKDPIKTIKDSTEVKNLLLLSKKYRYTDYEVAKKYANQANELAKEINFIKGEIESNYELGAYCILQGEAKKAYNHFNYGLNKSQSINNKLLVAFGYFHLSRYYLDIYSYSESIEFINKALKIFTELKKEIEVSRCFSSLGNIYKDLSNYERSLYYNFKSLKIKENLNDKRGVAILLSNNGNIYLLTNKYDEALDNFQKALELDRENNDTEGIVYDLTRIGVTYQKMQKLDEAIQYFQIALPITQELKFKVDESILLGNIGSTLRSQKKYKESLEYLFSALELKKELNQLGSASHTYNDICETYLEMGEVDNAKDFALKALKFSTNVNLNQEKYAYLLLAKCDYRLGNYKNSYESLIKSNILRDSIFSIEKAANMNELDVEYQTEKKENEILKLTDEKLIEEIKRYNYIIAGLITSLFLFLLYNNQRLKSLKNKHLLEKEKELDVMKSNFFTNISHEFRTPLTLILGPIDDLIKKMEQIEGKKRLEVIKRNAQRLLNLVNQLLDLSKIESGKLKLETSESDIIKVIKGVSMSFHSMAELKNIKLKLKVTPDQLNMGYDKKKFETIITNLLSNAIKFTPNNGKIIIKSKLVNSTVKGISREFLRINVSDSGIGIPKNELNQVFNRYFQSKNNRLLQQDGSGIGLAILKEYVELHEGNIIAKSKVGKGTRIIIEIPTDLPISKIEELSESVYDLKKQFEIEEDLSNLEEEDEKYNNDKAVILLIEDNEDVRNYINEILEKKYNVINAIDGEDGISKGLELIPNLIVSDVMMPKKNGYEVCTTFKKDERTSHIPIVLLTAKTSSEDKIEGLSTQADDYITKPFNPKELLIRIENLIESRIRLKEKYKSDGLLRPKEVTMNSLDEKFLNKIMELVEINMSDEKFGVEQLSIEIAMSRSQLHRKLKALLGQGPSHFIRVFRLQRAHDLLKQKSATAAEIGFEVGFSSPSYFTKCFHDLFGYTPTEIPDSSNQD